MDNYKLSGIPIDNTIAAQRVKMGFQPGIHPPCWAAFAMPPPNIIEFAIPRLSGICNAARNIIEFAIQYHRRNYLPD